MRRGLCALFALLAVGVVAAASVDDTDVFSLAETNSKLQMQADHDGLVSLIDTLDRETAAPVVKQRADNMVVLQEQKAEAASTTPADLPPSGASYRFREGKAEAAVQAEADQKIIGWIADGVNFVGNAAMDALGVPEDSTGRQVFNAVTDPIGTAIDYGMDKMGVPEDSPLRTAAHGASMLVCFTGDARVAMADGTERRIDRIKLGEETLGGRVTAVMQFEAVGVPLYSYQGVIVAGHHKVLEDGLFVAVKDSVQAVRIDETVDVLYDLDTTLHRIFVNNVTFADFSETDPLESVEKLELNQLNADLIAGGGQR